MIFARLCGNFTAISALHVVSYSRITFDSVLDGCSVSAGISSRRVCKAIPYNKIQSRFATRGVDE